MSPHLIIVGGVVLVVLYLVGRKDPELKNLLASLIRLIPWR